MQVEELFALTRWIDREVKEADIAGRYERLVAILNANTQPNQKKQPFETQKAALLEALRNVPLAELTTAQLEYLDCLGIAEHLGEHAAEVVEDVLYRNVIDEATAASRLQQAQKAVSDGIRRSDQIQQSLAPCVPEPVELEGEVLVRVIFSKKAAIGDIVDLKDWSERWHEIGRGIAMAHGASPEVIRVVGAGRGSIVIELALGYGIAKSVALILHEALKVTERVLTIRLKAEEIRGLRLANDGLARELEEEAEREKEEAVATITQAVAERQGLGRDMDGERIAALERTVAGLLDFSDKGGEVDCVVPSDDEEEAGPQPEEGDGAPRRDLAELRTAFQDVRLLERSVKQLAPGRNGEVAADAGEVPEADGE